MGKRWNNAGIVPWECQTCVQFKALKPQPQHLQVCASVDGWVMPPGNGAPETWKAACRIWVVEWFWVFRGFISSWSSTSLCPWLYVYNRWQALCHVPYFFLLSPSLLNGFIAFLWYLYLTLLLSSFLALSCGGSVTGFWFGFGVFCGGKFLFSLFFFLSHFTAVHLLWKIWKSKNAGYSGDCFLIPV